jgi:hypothetical protein
MYGGLQVSGLVAQQGFFESGAAVANQSLLPRREASMQWF